jgi:hypothetical protein
VPSTAPRPGEGTRERVPRLRPPLEMRERHPILRSARDDSVTVRRSRLGIEGESYEIELLTSTGASIDYEIEGAGAALSAAHPAQRPRTVAATDRIVADAAVRAVGGVLAGRISIRSTAVLAQERREFSVAMTLN